MGVESNATQKTIKRQYHKLALELHPDKNKPPVDSNGDMSETDEARMEEIVRRFIELVAAYEVLSDPERRKLYDTLGEDSLNRGSARERRAQKRQYSDEPFHMYSRFPGGSLEFHFTKKRVKKMETITRKVEISLKELFTGLTLKNMTVHRQRKCHHCHGTGAEKEEDIQECPLCQGSGISMFLHERCDENHHHHHHHDHHDHHHHHHHQHHHQQHHHKHPALQQIVNTTCSLCSGTGKIVPSNATCSVCGGVGTLTEPKVYSFNVTHDGQKFRFTDGSQAMNYQDGEVIFEVVAEEHPKFKIQDYNLIYDAKVELVDALIGFNKFIRHLDGRKIAIVHDVVTFHGYQHIVKNEGLLMQPRSHKGQLIEDERGDLIVNFDVVFPRALTDAQRNALRKVMDDDDVDVLEDVIALAAATEDAKDWNEERKYSFRCHPNKLVCDYNYLEVLRNSAL
jgi:DnaJ-class molecular chaperone